jgi:hypothetical protein
VDGNQLICKGAQAFRGALFQGLHRARFGIRFAVAPDADRPPDLSDG